MIVEPKQDDIDRAFRNTNFGPLSETPEGRRYLVAECIMKRVCAFHSGWTIEQICKELGLLTKQRNATKAAKHWAYCHIFDGLRQSRANESCQQEARAVALLREVAEWIDGWEPNFVDDAEWPAVAERIQAITQPVAPK